MNMLRGMHVDNLTFVQLALVQCSIDPLFNCPKFNYSDFQLSKVLLTSFSVVQSSIDTNVQLTFGCLTCHRWFLPPSLSWPHHRSSSFCSRCYARMVGRTRTVGRSVGWMDGKAGSSDTAAARRQLLCTSVYIQYKQCRRPRPLGLGPESNSLDQASRRFCAPKMWFSILAFLLPAASYLSQGRCTRVS